MLIHMEANDTARGNLKCIKSDYKDLRERIRKYRLLRLTLTPPKIMHQGPLEQIQEYMQEKEVIGKSQHGFTKSKSCLNNLIAFCDKMTVFVDTWIILTLTLSLVNPFQNTLPFLDIKNKNFI